METKNLSKSKIGKHDDDHKKGMGLVLAFLFFVVLGFVLENYSIIAFLLALLIITTAKFKYPKNLAITALFALYLFFLLILIVSALIMIKTCTDLVTSCPG